MILVDTSEPDSILELIQQGVPATKSPLNQNKIADYYFANYDGKKIQFGRVQAGELLSDIESMEDEFKRYYDSADETNQIIEGIISPTPLSSLTYNQIEAIKSGKLSWNEIRYEPKIRQPDLPSSRSSPKLMSFSYRVENITDKNGVTISTLASGRGYSIPISTVYVWIYRLSQLGINTYYTNNWEETARFLMTVFRNEQKPPDSHTTFKRIYRPKIYIKTEKNMTPTELDEYRFIKSLLFISTAYNLGIGETKARAISESFYNIMDLSMASVSELSSVEGIGDKTARKILSALGRKV